MSNGALFGAVDDGALPAREGKPPLANRPDQVGRQFHHTVGAADLTLEQVAAAIGTSQAFLARLENKKPLALTRPLERFAKAPGITVSYQTVHQLDAGMTDRDHGARITAAGKALGLNIHFHAPIDATGAAQFRGGRSQNRCF